MSSARGRPLWIILLPLAIGSAVDQRQCRDGDDASDYETASFRIQALEQEILSMKQTLQRHNTVGGFGPQGRQLQGGRSGHGHGQAGGGQAASPGVQQRHWLHAVGLAAPVHM
ncbi:hypothetical protein ABZP36_001011 [Zizania latifolia]